MQNLNSKIAGKNLDQLLWLFIAVICLSFLIFFIAIQWNNRVNNSDDFLFIERLWKQGFFESIVQWEYNKRPVSHFFFNVTFFLNNTIQSLRWSLFVQGLLFLILFTHSFKLVLQRLFLKLNIPLNQKRIWLLSFMLVICSFFYPFERSELWFWHICFVIYLLPFLFLNYTFVLLFEKGKIRWLSILFFMLIGGTAEVLILMTSCLLLILLWEKLISSAVFFINSGALFLMSVFQFFDRGIENRLLLESKQHIYNNGFLDIFIHLFDFKNVIVLLIAVIFIAVLQPYKQLFKRVNYQKVIIKSFLLLLVFFILTYTLSHVAFASFGPLRIWSTFSLFLLFFVLILIAFIISKFNQNLIIPGVLSGIVCLLLLGFFGAKQIRLTTVYAKKYDLVLKKSRNKEKYVDSGVLISTGNFDLLTEFVKKHNDEQ